MALCPGPPDAPYRSGGRIYCESTDPDEGREYAALIQVINGIEEPPILYGTDFDPFDGSSVEVTQPVSADNYYLCRSYCTAVGDYQDAIEAGGGPALRAEKPLHFAEELPKPPKPVLDKTDSRPGQIAIYFENSPAWQNGLAKLEAQGVTVERIRLMRYILESINEDQPIWKTLKEGEPNNDNKSCLFEGQDPKALFNREPKIDRDAKPENTYGYIAEVVFNFGQADNGRRYFRGICCEPLLVDMKQ